MLYFYGRKFCVKTYLPPAAPNSHQDRAKLTEYPKKPRGRRKKFFKQFLKNTF